ncbi:hypothetical protein XpiCFBP4643_21030 [Xanthomonas pisi]|uniref:GNAT family N-acetyltransferase n=1 Tax=Xanthomonas pisi TaxID=56457 RepID=A0A2S7CUP1_9XANT|nr:hypothetical protein XpiCFBP4643_21030 [Xanthomonas pisi]
MSIPPPGLDGARSIALPGRRWLGLKQIEGQVLRENRTMLAMCQSLGFGVRPDPDDATLMAVTLPVSPP